MHFLAYLKYLYFKPVVFELVYLYGLYLRELHTNTALYFDTTK
jgi:hypothetical protein